ncbi:THO complex subunit 5 homolog [Parasteatoda tepidariorum]|uniref:THO complex subunit 5 homolog n=1 Tax=Parasteatoda tepidariorum TaxID=114398 RepID=UPI00077FD0EE|nr:THO complex subunit 5 homolog [Parasteatoda tepidariorum]
MNKKEKSDSSSREKKAKRIKTHHSRPNILSIIPVNTDCFRLEEQEASENCHLRFIEICEKIRATFQSMLVVKKGKENEEFLLQNKPRVTMWVISLKKLNRLDKHHWKKSRDAVNDKKQNIDALTLQWQNLLYEATHLQKEVTKCLEFRSKDEEIQLVSVEEFYRDAPKSISKRQVTSNDTHQLKLARLLWESEQRKINAAKLKELELKKEEYNQEIKKLKQNLANIRPILKSIIEAAEPFQSKMGMPFFAKQKMHVAAKYLPRPLYVLYVQANAYLDYSGKKIKITVEGNIDDVKALQLKRDELSEESGESDQEDNAESSMHRHTLSRSKSNVSKDIMMKHPMSVHVTIDVDDSSVQLQFMYMVHLNIITVSTVSLIPEPMSDDKIGDLLRHDVFLNCLFPNDTGRDTPNLSNIFLLRKKFGPEEHPFSNETTGLPYIWAQEISGLLFISPNENTNEYKQMYKEIPFRMERSINAICTRLTSRQQLYQQIISLEQRINVPPTFAALYPSKISSQLKSWNPTSWKELANATSIDELMNLNIVAQDHLIYSAQLDRGSACLCAFVCIDPSYPVKTPVFLLQLFWKGTHTSVSSFALRELEEEVNVHFVESLPEEYKSNLLLCQLYHLAVCFDVFLETEHSGDSFEGPHEFVRDKVVVKHTRGRTHSRPYKCISSQGIFTYR